MSIKIGHILESLSKLNYFTAKEYYIHRLKKIDKKFNNKPLLVYQMGKVGSSSVVASLEKEDINRRIYHIHFLEPSLIKKYEKKRRRFLGTKRELDLKHIWQYSYLYDQIQKKKDKEKYKVITLVRDPVARNLATFFEHIEVLPNESDTEWHLKSVEYDFELIIPKHNLNNLIKLFYDKCRHDSPLIYFDREFKKIFNMDIYEHDFSFSKGYRICGNDKVEILLIKLEKLNDCAGQALKEFMGIDNFQIINKNVGSDKEYADIYNLFKNSIQLPSTYLNKMYKSRFCRHFYSEEEIVTFTKRWTTK